MEREESTKNNNHYPISKKTIVFGIVPFIVIGAMLILLLSSPGILFQSAIEPLPQISIEKVEFSDQYIIASVRNTGPSEITIAQADVNDRIHPAAIEPDQTLSKFSDAKVIIPFIWNSGEPYNIGITTDDGTRFEKTIDSAAQVPRPTIEQASSFALIGTYVGVIPVMMGLVWYPFIRRLSISKYNFFLSLTAGLLVFLGIDALLESNEIAMDNLAPAFNSQILIIIITIVSFLALQYVSQKLVQRASKSKSDIGYKSENTSRPTPPDLELKDVGSSSGTSLQQQLLIRPLAISMMISIGIGLHNFGEGLAIGAAVLLGEIALSSFLILGFTLHNTTEGLAIVAPMAKTRRIPIRKLIIMGLIAGVPTILGTWIGGFLYSPVATVIFLSIGAGAIFQVVYSIGSWMHHTNGSKGLLGNLSIITGFALGMLFMYLTGLLI